MLLALAAVVSFRGAASLWHVQVYLLAAVIGYACGLLLAELAGAAVGLASYARLKR